MNKLINPSDVRPPFASYSHAVVTPPGPRLLFTSGQLGISPDDKIPESVEEQAVICFENIGAILKEAGMTFQHVVRFSAFVTDRSYFPIYGKIRERYVGGSGYASTLLIVSGFTLPAFKIEVEVTAAMSD